MEDKTNITIVYDAALALVKYLKSHSLTYAEMSRINKFYNRHLKIDMSSPRTMNLVEYIEERYIHPANSEKEDWVASSFISELSRIKRFGRCSVHLDITNEEFVMLRDWLRGKID